MKYLNTKIVQLKCEEGFSRCTQSEDNGLSASIFWALNLTIVSLGSLANWLCYYIFSTMDGQHLNQKFISTMKIYSINSFFYCLNVVISGAVLLSTIPSVYESERCSFQLFPSLDFMLYYVYICVNFSVFPYTIGCFMDIYIAYTRIQVFKPNYKFLSQTPVQTVAFSIIIISIVITLPINISRQVITYQFEMTETNTSIVLHTYDLSRFSNNQIFVGSIYLSNFVRDVLSIAIEIVFNAMIMFYLKRSYYNKIRLTGRPDEALSHVEKTNMVITIIISFLSILMRIVLFLVFFSSVQSVTKKFFSYIFIIAAVLVASRHSVNIFIFYALNSAFRKRLNYVAFKIE